MKGSSGGVEVTMRPEPKLSVKIALTLLGIVALAAELWDQWKESRRDAV